MSFSITNAQTGMEFGFRTLNGLFAQRRNLVRPSFYRLLYEGFSFLNKLYVKDLTGNGFYRTKHEVTSLCGATFSGRF
jgi:predicted NAD/FAD-binding protein